MSYRKITVDGIKYQYVVGPKFLHIKNIGTYSISEVGQPMQMGVDNRYELDGPKYFITPFIVMNLIKANTNVRHKHEQRQIPSGVSPNSNS
jgi:hypothetical protein